MNVELKLRPRHSFSGNTEMGLPLQCRRKGSLYTLVHSLDNMSSNWVQGVGQAEERLASFSSTWFDKHLLWVPLLSGIQLGKPKLKVSFFSIPQQSKFELWFGPGNEADWEEESLHCLVHKYDFKIWELLILRCLFTSYGILRCKHSAEVDQLTSTLWLQKHRYFLCTDSFFQLPIIKTKSQQTHF
jgi:hypothetical protein